MKNILYISMMMPYVNASNGGAKTFYYYLSNMGKIAVKNGFKITLIAKALSDKEKKVQIDGIEIIVVTNPRFLLLDPIKCVKDINSKINPFNGKGNTLRESIYEKIKTEINTMRCAPDVVVLEFTQMVFLAGFIKEKFPKAKIMASEHDVSFLLLKRKIKVSNNIVKKIYAYIRYKAVKKYELRSLHFCDIIMPHNQKDAKLLIKNGILHGKVKTIVPYYEHLNINREPNCKDVIFYGAMDRPENYLSCIWFLKNVMPLLDDVDIRLLVIGGNPCDELQKYVSDKVEILGFVKNLDVYFQSCICMVAPLVLGAGIKIKVLEAMYAGVPTLTNTIGIEGIPAKDKKDYFHCEIPVEYNNVIRSLMKGDIDTKQISESAHQCIADNFNIERAFEEYVNMINL